MDNYYNYICHRTENLEIEDIPDKYQEEEEEPIDNMYFDECPNYEDLDFAPPKYEKATFGEIVLVRSSKYKNGYCVGVVVKVYSDTRFYVKTLYIKGDFEDKSWTRYGRGCFINENSSYTVYKIQNEETHSTVKKINSYAVYHNDIISAFPPSEVGSLTCYEKEVSHSFTIIHCATDENFYVYALYKGHGACVRANKSDNRTGAVNSACLLAVENYLSYRNQFVKSIVVK